MLQFGFIDYSEDTPPLCSFSPISASALSHCQLFKAEVEQEIDKDWFTVPQIRPRPYLPT